MVVTSFCRTARGDEKILEEEEKYKSEKIAERSSIYSPGLHGVCFNIEQDKSSD